MSQHRSGQQCSTKEIVGKGEEALNAFRYFWRRPRNNRGGLRYKLTRGSFIQENKQIQVNSIASHVSQRHCILPTRKHSVNFSVLTDSSCVVSSGFPSPLTCPSPAEESNTTRQGMGTHCLAIKKVLPSLRIINLYVVNGRESPYSAHCLSISAPFNN